MKIESEETKKQVSDTLYRTLLDESSDPIFAFAQDGTYLYVNNAFAIPNKRDKENIIGKKIWDIFPGEEGDKRFAAVKEVFNTGVIKTIEVKIPGDLYFLTTVKPVKNINNEIKMVICISKNITELKKIREELENKKEAAETANRAKSEFISNMSHEIRTPLNAVIGFSELMKNSKSNENNNDYLKGIITGGKSLLNIINDILDLSKVEAGKLTIQYEPVNIYSVLNEINQIFAFQLKNKNINMIFDIAENIPKYLMLDEIRIRQVLFNIVGNAIKFTNKGYVKISLMAKQDNLSTLKLIFQIEDSGIGIPEEQTEKIFEAFQQQEGQNTKKYGGTGLGLTISKKMVEMMNGTINVKSQVNKGSIFTIELRNVEVSSIVNFEKKEDENINENIKFENSLVLYAEDIESNRKVIRGYLEELNIKIEEAKNGLEAYEKAKILKPNIILLDIHMPVMDGIEAFDLIKMEQETAEIPIIALTASAINDEIETIKTKFNDFIEKPVYRKKLVSILKKYLKYEIIENTKEEINIPEVIDYLLSEKEKNDIRKRIEKLSEAIILDEINELTEILRVIGELQNSTYMIKTSELLRNAVSNYETEKIEKIIKKLTMI